MKADNELIAEFMGINFTDKKAYLRYPPPICKRFGLYDRSWAWLMPVVEKIESLEFNVNIVSTWCDVERKTKKVELIVNVEGTTKMLATYKAVVQFVKWYNSQSKLTDQ